MSCTVADFVRESLIFLNEKVSVAEGVNQMVERNLGSIIVTRDEEVIGLFTEQDLLKRVVGHKLNPADVPLGDICTRRLVSIAAEASCREAVLKMRSNSCRRLLVYRGARFLGLIELQDVAHGIANEGGRKNWLPNLIVGLTLMLVFGVIILLIFQLPEMLNIAKRVSGP